MDRLPEDTREDFLTDYVHEIRRMRYIEDNNNEQEKFLSPYSLAILLAKKPT